MKKFYFQVALAFVMSVILGYFSMQFMTANKGDLISLVNSLSATLPVSNKTNLGKNFKEFTY